MTNFFGGKRTRRQKLQPANGSKLPRAINMPNSFKNKTLLRIGSTLGSPGRRIVDGLNKHGEWDSVRREEQALLDRCKMFLISHPSAPGRVLGQRSKHIVYYTPCGRWLRICSTEVIDGFSVSPDVERAYLLDIFAVKSLFGLYAEGVLLPQFEEPKVREAHDRMTRAFWDKIFENHPMMSDREKTSVEHLGATSQERESTKRPGCPTESEPSASELFQALLGQTEEIPRNLLVIRLRDWAKGWPAEPVDAPISQREPQLVVDLSDLSSRPPVAQDVRSTFAEQVTPKVLREFGSSITSDRHKRDYLRAMRILLQPVTQRVLKSEMAEFARAPEKVRCYEGTDGVNNSYLAQLNRSQYIDNNQSGNPKGYVLTQEGIELADYYLSHKPGK